MTPTVRCIVALMFACLAAPLFAQNEEFYVAPGESFTDHVASGDRFVRVNVVNAGRYEKTGPGRTVVTGDILYNMDSGTLTVREGTFAFENAPPWGWWSNFGTINVAAGQVKVIGNAHYDIAMGNHGTINIEAGSMTIEWIGRGFDSSGGVWNIAPGAELSFVSYWGDAPWLIPLHTTFADTTIHNEGTLRFSGPFTVGYFAESARLTGSGRVLVEDGARVIYAAIPEPGSALLTLTGITLLGVAPRRRAAHISRCSPALSPPRIT